jgi:predicted nuclease with TOPRIM domain
MSASELKALKTKQSKLRNEITKAGYEASKIEEKKKTLQYELRDIDASINRISAGVEISEHAILRYLERIEGVDIEEVRKKILPPEVREQIQILGSGVFPVAGFKLRARDNVIVTVMESSCKQEK